MFFWTLRQPLFYVSVRRCAPSVGGVAIRPPGSAGCSSSSQAPWLRRRRWPYTPSWRRRRTTSTSTASGTCWLRGAWASSCRLAPSPTPRWPRWSAGGAAAISCASTSTRNWAWWTPPSSPSTASAPADKLPRHAAFYLRDTSLPSFTWGIHTREIKPENLKKQCKYFNADVTHWISFLLRRRWWGVSSRWLLSNCNYSYL